jgi:hypothetical protein
MFFVGICSGQDKPKELSAREAAQEFLKTLEKAEKDDASLIEKIDADTMMAVLAIFLSEEAENALNDTGKIVKENKLLKQIAETEKEPLSIVKFDLIKDLFEAKYKENEDVRNTTNDVLNKIEKLQKQQDANTTTLDYKIKELEKKLINDPNDKDTWEQITNARFIKEIVQKNTNKDEIKKFVIAPLTTVDKDGMEPALRDSFSFLEKYYEGLISEYLGENDEALFAFWNAEWVTSDPKYKIIAGSKIFELQILANKR